jgi:hypothetical protein
VTTRQQLEDDVRGYFAERGLFLDFGGGLETVAYPAPRRRAKARYVPQRRTLEQLPLWLDYYLEGRPPKLPGELELVSVEWCPVCAGFLEQLASYTLRPGEGA